MKKGIDLARRRVSGAVARTLAGAGPSRTCGSTNEYWPALYFIDARGQIRHHQFGEGDYGQSERVLQGLLAESGKAGLDRQLARNTAQGIEAPADCRVYTMPLPFAERMISSCRSLSVLCR
jgi:hypothetical protein